ncbi:MAG: M15 family metallopeptidase [Amphritea sp.]|nr:M15 family metallopeptidase [Amphritea sp.]
MHRLTPSSPEILAVPIEECFEHLVDIRAKPGLQFGPPPECPETVHDYTLMREGVYMRLCRAQKLLPDGIFIRVYEAYRSLEVQQMLFGQEQARVRERQPELCEDDVFVEATRLVSAVQYPDGSNNIPPHNTGAAVDIELVNWAGHPLDFGMDIHRWTEVDPDLCLTDAQGLTQRARDNRQLLAAVMTEAGFVNYPEEWWHFSYGDRFWAYTTGHSHAIYGGIDQHVLSNL